MQTLRILNLGGLYWSGERGAWVPRDEATLYELSTLPAELHETAIFRVLQLVPSAAERVRLPTDAPSWAYVEKFPSGALGGNRLAILEEVGQDRYEEWMRSIGYWRNR